jgi:hypothetical protein
MSVALDGRLPDGWKWEASPQAGCQNIDPNKPESVGDGIRSRHAKPRWRAAAFAGQAL